MLKKVIGISGRKTRKTQWDRILYIPFKSLPKKIKENFIVTHDLNVASYCERVVNVIDGEITKIKDKTIESCSEPKL